MNAQAEVISFAGLGDINDRSALSSASRNGHRMTSGSARFMQE